MNDNAFIVKERTIAANDRFRLLWRLLSAMKLFNRLLPLSLVLLLGGHIVPQVYLWIIGQLSSCDGLPCTVPYPRYVTGTLEISLKLLSVILAFNVVVQLLSWLVFELSAQWSVVELHDRMMQKISAVRTTYFDEHPSGRILNRLVRDFDLLSQHVVIRFSDTVYYLLSIVIAVILAWLVQPLILVLTVPILGLVLYIQWEIALMNERVISERSAALSSVLHRETDVIEGGRVFALYDALPALVGRLCRAVDRYVHFHLWQIELERYGRSMTGVLRVVFTGAVLIVTVFSLKTGRMSEALALVLLSQLPPLQNKFSGLAWAWLNTIQSFATVRRIFEYVDLDSEESTERETKQLDQRKTAQNETKLLAGDLVFEHYSMSYRPHLPRILNDVSMRLPYGKRIALLGRTGSGKTSLVQALFRMVYVQEGDIKIGDQSIFAIAIPKLREHFVVVPQEPYLFAGTLRVNLDYESIHPDALLEQTLTRVGLALDLELVLLEGGENLSVGERQLLCLARALLVEAPYVIMDEPTSSVDSITDQKMQRIIREEFSGRTIITIAHRLETVRDNDWVIELAQGRVLYQGPAAPYFLEQNFIEQTNQKFD